MGFCLLLGYLLCFTSQAGEKSIRVEINIHCDDDFAAQEIGSYVRRELRSFDDIQIVDKDDDDSGQNSECALDMIVIAQRSSTGRIQGYAIANAFSYVFYSSIFEDVELARIAGILVENPIREEMKDAYEKKRSEKYKEKHYINSTLHTTPDDGLKRTVESIVAEFDTEALEPYRNTFRTKKKRE